MLLALLRVLPDGEADFSIATKTTQSQDPRNAPIYGIGEAARYLHLAPATLRSWVIGRPYTVKGGERYFEPLIRLPHPDELRLSFLNLVEAHNLRALRTRHQVPIRAVREALRVAEREYDVKRLLTSHELSAGAGELFLNHYGELISLDRSGQIALKRILDAYLERIEWDPAHQPCRLYPFLTGGIGEPRVIAIDPRIGFGRPILLRKGISTAAIAERVNAGEEVLEVAEDYELEPKEVEDALIYERAAQLIFFSDRDLGAHIFPQVVRAAGIRLERHVDHFADDAPDEEWLSEVARRGWVILTHDQRIRYKTNELSAVMSSGAAMIVLVGKATTLELAQNFLNSIDRVRRFVDGHDRPFIAKLYRPTPISRVATGEPGRIEMWISGSNREGRSGA